MTARRYQEGDQHCMLTASVILQCICIVIAEAFIYNSNYKKYIKQPSSHHTHTPSSLTSVSLISLPLSLSYSLHPPSPPSPFTPCLHSQASRSSYSVILTHPTRSILCIPIHIILSLLATSSYLSYSLPHSFPHSLTPLPESLSVSLILSHSRFCYSLSNSFTLVHHPVSLTPLPHSFSHSFPCLTDFASLTPSLTLLPHSLPWLTHILPVSLPH